jgi:hypothetical protein
VIQRRWSRILGLPQRIGETRRSKTVVESALKNTDLRAPPSDGFQKILERVFEPFGKHTLNAILALELVEGTEGVDFMHSAKGWRMLTICRFQNVLTPPFDFKKESLQRSLLEIGATSNSDGPLVAEFGGLLRHEMQRFVVSPKVCCPESPR